MKNNAIKKTLYSLVSLAVILTIVICSFYIIYTLPAENELLASDKNLNTVQNELSNIENSLQQKTLELENLQSGNEYELHDPLYEEVISFIENDTSPNTNQTIENAKKQGLRCALVEIIMGWQLYMYERIAFETVDNGTIYYETDKDYQIIPEMGKKYLDCVVGRPYEYETFDSTIVDILKIW